MKAIEAKIVLLGAQGVGKTSLVVKYITNVYSKDVGPTIGATFFNCRINLEDIKVKMQIWDTAGQERFRSMAPLYYRGANAALLVFDLTNYASFGAVKTWVSELQRNVQEPMVLTLVGSKSDLEMERAVAREEAAVYATSIGGNYFETSAITTPGFHCIERVFTQTALGLVRLSQEAKTQIRHYESTDSLPSITASVTPTDIGGGVSLAIESDGVACETGRVENVAFSIDHIAHGNEAKTGCCWY
uniref:Putative rab subfamily protein of small gtpase n=1 Tax=Nyssomyia neivai TaxID=330878 RepID=A0A1L8DV73_9DIPT